MKLNILQKNKIVEKITYQINLIFKIGIINYVIGLKETIENKYYQKKYKFNKWHITGYHLKPYTSQVVSIINGLHPNSIVEIGCGLGDIIKKTKAAVKIGIDIEENVICAASSINKNNGVKFIVGDFLKAKDILHSIEMSKIDVLLMVNWPHQISYENLQQAIVNTLNCIKVNYIVIDIIKSNSHGYKYHHKIKDLENIGTIVNITDGTDGIREIITIMIKKQLISS